MGEKGRHRGNDSGAIRTGQREDELMIGHGLDDNSGRRVTGLFAALLYHRQALAPVRKPGQDEQKHDELRWNETMADRRTATAS